MGCFFHAFIDFCIQIRRNGFSQHDGRSLNLSCSSLTRCLLQEWKAPPLRERLEC